MKLAMTLMVRDEADIIQAMLDHHLACGVDIIIVTDNGSVDGTAEILSDYAARGLIDLRHDPEHRKQQGVTVTQMARDAATIHGADWVINADADEFWVPVDDNLTLHSVFEQLDTGMQAFTVEVLDMTGPPAERGSGLQRLVYRDQRSVASMNEIALLAHATADAVHVADPEIIVHQGNHFVSLESKGSPPPELALEVLHFPWRSWSQYRRKVENAGRSYLNASGLKPSPNHHGMRDYKRLLDNTLLPSYIVRHPSQEAIRHGLETGEFVLEQRIAASMPSPVVDELFDETQENRERALGTVISTLEFRVRTTEDTLKEETARLETRLATCANEVKRLRTENAALRDRRVVRFADAVSRRMHREKPPTG